MPKQKIKHLGFSREYALEILLGLKRATVRKTDKGLRENDIVMLHARGKDGGVIGWGRICSVAYKRVSALSDRDAEHEGFLTRDELLEALREHFRNLNPDEEISIIRFRVEKINPEFAARIFTDFAKRVLSSTDVCIDPVDRSLIEEFLKSDEERKLQLSTDKNVIRAFKRAYLVMRLREKLREEEGAE